MENFKSYKNVVVLGPFSKRFSAIVGPNGTGKSNIIDALLFVFGSKSRKIRAENNQKLINWAAASEGVTKAEVTVGFTEITTVRGRTKKKEFTLARVVNRSGTHYKHNGRRMEKGEVEKFLKTKNIDMKNNRIFILQGDVKAIALMQPKQEEGSSQPGLLEFIEELIGTKDYVEKIEKVEATLKDKQEAQSSLLAKLKASEKARDALMSSKDETVKMLQKICESKKIEILLHIGIDLHAVATTYKSENEQLQKVVEDQKEAAKKKAETVLKGNRLKIERDEAQKNYQTVLREYKKINTKLGTFDTRKAQYAERIKHLEEEQKNYTKKHKQIIKKEKELVKKKLLAETETIPELEKEYEEKTKYQIELQEELEKQTEKYREQTEELDGKIQDAEEELAQLREVCNEKEEINDDVKNRMQEVRGSSIRIQKELQKQQSNLKKAELEKKDLKREGGEKAMRLSQIETDLRPSKEKFEDLQHEQVDVERRYQKAQEIYKRKRRLFEQQRPSNGDRALPHLLEAQKRGELSGIYGTLGDLGSVAKRFETAASTAGRSSLSMILVEDSNAAQKCIEFLKRNNCGRGRFCCLNKQQKHRNLLRRPNVPNGYDRILDLIHTDDKFKPAFAMAFKNCLVAKDLDSANKVAYGKVDGKRWRTVTLDGAVVETSGAMSGGGSRTRSLIKTHDNNASQNDLAETFERVTEEEVNELEREYKDLQTNSGQLRSEIRKLQQKIQKMEGDVAPFKDATTRIDFKYRRNKEYIKQIKKTIKKLEADLEQESNDEEEAELQKELDIAQAALDEAKKKKNKGEKKVKTLKQKKRNTGDDEYKKLKKDLKKVGETIKKIEESLEKWKVTMPRWAIKIKSYADDLLDDEREVKKIEIALETSKAKIEKFLNGIEALTERHKKLEEKEAELKEKYLEKKNAFEGMTEAFRECRVTEDNLNRQEAQHKQVINSCKFRKGELKTLIDESLKQLREIEKQIADFIDDFVGFEVPKLNNQEEMKAIQTAEDKLRRKLRKLKEDADSTEINYQAIQQWQRLNKKYIDYCVIHAENKKIVDKYKRELIDTKEERQTKFMYGFEKIKVSLKKIYRLLTSGGDADLEFIDSLDPFEDGIRLTARPPRKHWMAISKLSGGEQTLTSLSLIFALHEFNPAPLYVMDEIDAALDFKNTSVVANYIQQEGRSAQFIIVSLRDQLFLEADKLIGIYKIDQATGVVTYHDDEEDMIMAGEVD